MTITRNAKIAIFIAAIAIVALGVFRLRQAAEKNDQIVKVGSILALTGPAGLIGQELLAGQKLGVEYWSSRSQFPIAFIFEDSKASPRDGLSAFKSLQARGYAFLIANISGVALAIKPEVNPTEVSFLAIASHPGIAEPAQPGVFLYSQ